MRAMKWPFLVAVAILAIAMVPAAPIPSLVTSRAQGMDPGVFGLGEDDWAGSENASVRGDTVEIPLDDGNVLEVRLNDGVTVSVVYHLAEPLTIDDASRFAVEELLPGDVEFRGEYVDILPGRPGEAVVVQLFESEDLARYLPDYSGIILLAWQDDGTMFSLNIGR